MAKKLAKVLQTEFSGDMSALAQLLQSKGRGKDTILAHITPEEAKKLKADGGSGSRNPDTGLLEFYPEYDPNELPGQTVYAERPGADFVVNPYGTGSFGARRSRSGGAGPVDDSGGLTGSAEIGPTMFNSGVPAGGIGKIGLDPQLVSSLKKTEADIDEELKKQPAKQPFYQRAVDALGGYGGLAQLGLTGLLGIQGQKQAREAAKQGQQYAAEQRAMGLPYQVAGQRMATAAERGELTPQSRQAYEAARAQMAQASESRGGVAAAQAATQLESLRQQLLQNQYTYGLQVANIGDNIVLGAIRTGMQADQYVNQATMQFYGMLGNFAAQNWRTPKTDQATQTTGITQGAVS